MVVPGVTSTLRARIADTLSDVPPSGSQRWYRQDMDLCDGTLIVHAGNIAECTTETCDDLDASRHTFVVDCYDLAGGCACEVAIRRAS